MYVRFIGSGDAFGSGGRLNTCFHMTGKEANFLIDCGATAPVGLARDSVDQNRIETILLTHYHLDHAGGLPGFLLNAQFNTKRTEPLTVAGPPPLAGWLEQWMETAFAGSSKTEQRFDLRLVELRAEQTSDIGGIRVTPFQVEHGPAIGICHAYRIEVEGLTIAYTGDTEWVDALIPAGQQADLLIAEAYTWQKRVPFHLDLATLEARLPEIAPRRLVLTHMGADMLARRHETTHETAKDGMVIEIGTDRH